MRCMWRPSPARSLHPEHRDVRYFVRKHISHIAQTHTPTEALATPSANNPCIVQVRSSYAGGTLAPKLPPAPLPRFRRSKAMRPPKAKRGE
eukprot:5312765-Prymnesium_polylepis.1